MSHYRLYALNAADRITSVVELNCESDTEAMAEARGLQNAQATELWQLGRKVAAFPANFEPDDAEREG